MFRIFALPITTIHLSVTSYKFKLSSQFSRCILADQQFANLLLNRFLVSPYHLESVSSIVLAYFTHNHFSPVIVNYGIIPKSSTSCGPGLWEGRTNCEKRTASKSLHFIISAYWGNLWNITRITLLESWLSCLPKMCVFYQRFSRSSL